VEAQGTIVDNKFEIESQIGSGGFGCVYRARQLHFDRVVALKIFHDVLTETQYVQRFEREAKIISLMQQRNVVRFYGFGVWQKSLYLAMEFIEGESLEKLLAREKRLSSADSILIIKQVLEALKAAHAQGVVHRDLKPTNIMISLRGGLYEVTVIDFGLAKAIGQDITAEGAAVGSVLYMSPEQCCGRDVDFRSDIYAAGCVLQTCLTGLPPFSDENSIVVMRSHVQDTALSLEQVCPDVHFSDGLQWVLNGSLQKDRDQRYQSAADMLQDLELLEAGRVSEMAAKNIVAPAVKSRKYPLQFKLGHSRAVVLAAMIVLSGVALTCYFANRGSNSYELYRRAMAANLNPHTASRQAVRELDLFVQSIIRNQRPGDKLTDEQLIDLYGFECGLKLFNYHSFCSEIENIAQRGAELSLEKGIYRFSTFQCAHAAVSLLSARDYYDKAQEFGEKFTNIPCPAEAEVEKMLLYKDMAAAAFYRGDNSAALRYIKFVRDCKTKEWYAEENAALKGEIALKSGDIVAAKEEFGKAVALGEQSPPQGRTALGLARAAVYGNDWKTAAQLVADYRTDQNHKEFTPLLSVMLARQGKWDEAETHMNKCLDVIEAEPYRFYQFWVDTDVPVFLKLAEQNSRTDIAKRIGSRFDKLRYIKKPGNIYDRSNYAIEEFLRK
jgi:tetratricopeptide (TPR) repeat protein